MKAYILVLAALCCIAVTAAPLLPPPMAPVGPVAPVVPGPPVVINAPGLPGPVAPGPFTPPIAAGPLPPGQYSSGPGLVGNDGAGGLGSLVNLNPNGVTINPPGGAPIVITAPAPPNLGNSQQQTAPDSNVNVQYSGIPIVNALPIGPLATPMVVQVPGSAAPFYPALPTNGNQRRLLDLTRQ